MLKKMDKMSIDRFSWQFSEPHCHFCLSTAFWKHGCAFLKEKQNKKNVFAEIKKSFGGWKIWKRGENTNGLIRNESTNYKHINFQMFVNFFSFSRLDH